MEPINFKQANSIFKGPENSNILDLPAFRDGRQIISKWELTDDEIKTIIETKSLFLGVQGQAMPPVFLTVDSPFVEFKNSFAYCHLLYTPALGKDDPQFGSKRIFVNGDFPVPSTFKFLGETYYLKSKKENTTPKPGYAPEPGEWCFVRANDQLYLRFISTLANDWVNVNGFAL